MKEINLEEIFLKNFKSIDCYIDYDKPGLRVILDSIKEACELAVDLCADSADADSNFVGNPIKSSILDVKKLIKSNILDVDRY